MCASCQLQTEEHGHLFDALQSPVTNMQAEGFGTSQKHDPEHDLTYLQLWTDSGYVQIIGEFHVKAVAG